ncbi:dihydrolipoyl dehydrogenase family protein [Nonomuraea sp. 10N515B]|uniref:dihydrolipoyl dehydrogenase family protein n=1 Tax=Nonomuraea sp. 10N515B TaxID=3457422 RepID=UPI003FCD2D8B
MRSIQDRTNRWERRSVGEDYDLIVIGAGAAGLAAARTGVRYGARTLLVSGGEPGGDCTFTGCVPSKTLIAAAARGEPFDQAMRGVRHAVAHIAATEDADALTQEGIEVCRDYAAFHSPSTIQVGNRRLRAAAFIIATGGRPSVPLVPGLATSPYLTSDDVFELVHKPHSMAVLGGGAIGCELAQAFGRLGVDVTLVEAAERVLPGEDRQASEVIAATLTGEGVTLVTDATVARVERDGDGVRLTLDDDTTLNVQRLLLAVGHSPDIHGLGLERAGVRVDDDRGGVRTDRHLATTAPGIYAAGDVTGRLQLTHAAYLMGRTAVHNALHRRKRAYDESAIPRVTFTGPEVAQVGLTEAEAAGRGARAAYLPMSELDRAVTEGATDGFIKIIAGPRRILRQVGGGRVLGATIVAPRAGEMINELALAMRTRMFTGRLAQTTHAYPTWSMAVQQAAAQFFGTYGGHTAQPISSPANRRSIP